MADDFAVRRASLVFAIRRGFRAQIVGTPRQSIAAHDRRNMGVLCRLPASEEQSRERRVTPSQQGLGKAKKGVQLFLEADPYLNSMGADEASVRQRIVNARQ
jgi:hypothetical protein